MAVNPLVAEGGLGVPGVLIGDDAFGGSFWFCFAGEERYITWDGVQSFAATAGTTQFVLTRQGQGPVWVQAEISEFGEQRLYEVRLSRGRSTKIVHATAEHRWFVARPNTLHAYESLPEKHRRQAFRQVTTIGLRPDDVLDDILPPSRIAESTPDGFGIAHGVVFGDGSASGSSKPTHPSVIDLWGPKDLELLRYFPASVRYSIKNARGLEGVRVYGLPRFFKDYPSLDEAVPYLYGWLAGYFAADGTVTPAGQVTLSSTRREHLEFVETLCLRLGIGTYGIRQRQRGSSYGSGLLYELCFVPATLRPEFFLLKHHRERYTAAMDKRRRPWGWRVVSVRPTDRVEPVYCATVPSSAAFALEGYIYTGNCPFELYERGIIKSPNMLVLGRLGFAKSALVKTFLMRRLLYVNRLAADTLARVRVWVIDPKGEYDVVARAWGVEPIRFKGDGALRINPLDPMMSRADQLGLLRAIAAVVLGRGLTPAEEGGLRQAHTATHRRADIPTIPLLVDELFSPSDDAEHELKVPRARIAEENRQLALAMHRMVGDGDLGGMFDGPTSSALNLTGQQVIYNLREVKDAARPVLMACVSAWLQSIWTQPGRRDKHIVVMEEAWSALRHLSIARWQRESIKLSREYGVMNIMVMHRLSDLTAAGDEGSEQVQLAKGMLEDTEIRVIYNQAPGELGAAARLLGLSTTECELIPDLDIGEALWKIGGRSFYVQHRLGRVDHQLVDTNKAMRIRADDDAEGRAEPAVSRPPAHAPVHAEAASTPQLDPPAAGGDPSDGEAGSPMVVNL